MKCRYQFPIKGFVKFPVGFHFEKDSRIVEFLVDKGFVTHIVIIADFPVGSLPTFQNVDKGKVKGHIHIPHDPNWDDISTEVRLMEGVLSFWGIKEIDTENCEQIFVPESDAERSKLTLFSFQRGKADGPPEGLPNAHMDLLARSVLAMDDLEEYEVAFNFFRRGKLDVFEKRFIESIYDFFFVLETLYADGKFKSKQVEANFLKSGDLMSAIDLLQAEISPHVLSTPALKTEFESKYLSKSKEEIVRRLVSIRGELHHHSRKKRSFWHPAKQKEYEVDAEVFMTICHQILNTKVVDKIFEEKQLEVFKGTKFTAEDGRNINWTVD